MPNPTTTKDTENQARNALTVRLRSARAVLKDEYRARFERKTIDFDQKRMLSDDGLLALQWVEDKTSQGSVYLLKIAEGHVSP